MNTLDEQTLTRMLLESGQLTGGVVENAVQTPSSYTAFTSKIYDLRLTYSADSTGKRPERALMKVTEAPIFRAGRAEASFYAFANQDRRQNPDALVEIYGNLVDDGTRLAVLLMKDMAGPFIGSDWPVPFQQRDCVRVVQALAGVHAHWWGDVRVDAERATRGAGREADDLRIRSSAQNLIDRLGDALSPGRRALIERLADVYPHLHESRLAGSGRQTVVHGDAHLWNFLIPEDESRVSLL
ncbi:MAG: phosphotransferase, partial [Pseudomonadales bacterium]|nr:phosphotransferase [Pseudomonadales bacterium]